MTPLREIVPLLKWAAVKWNEHDAPRVGAALAYYALLSLAPLTVIATALGGLVFNHSVTQERFVYEVRLVAGGEVAGLIKNILQQAREPSSSLFASALGLAILLIGASGIFAELRAALNRMWDVPVPASNGLLNLLWDRLLSIAMVVGIGFLMVVSLMMSVALNLFDKAFAPNARASLSLLNVLNFLGSFVGIALMFALLLRFLPSIRPGWPEVFWGGFIGAFLFTIGKTFLGIYLGRAAVGSLYGAGGSVVVITVWVYYSAQLYLEPRSPAPMDSTVQRVN